MIVNVSNILGTTYKRLATTTYDNLPENLHKAPFDGADFHIFDIINIRLTIILYLSASLSSFANKHVYFVKPLVAPLPVDVS